MRMRDLSSRFAIKLLDMLAVYFTSLSGNISQWIRFSIFFDFGMVFCQPGGPYLRVFSNFHNQIIILHNILIIFNYLNRR